MINNFWLASVMKLNKDIVSSSAKSYVIINSETIPKIQQTLGYEALSQTQIKEWLDCFKNG